MTLRLKASTSKKEHKKTPVVMTGVLRCLKLFSIRRVRVDGNGTGVIIPTHTEVEQLAEVAEFEIVITVNGVSRQTGCVAVHIYGVGRQLGGLLDSLTGSEFAANSGVCGIRLEFNALSRAVPRYFKLFLCTRKNLCDIAELEVIVVVNAVRVECYLFAVDLHLGAGRRGCCRCCSGRLGCRLFG